MVHAKYFFLIDSIMNKFTF